MEELKESTLIKEENILWEVINKIKSWFNKLDKEKKTSIKYVRMN